MQATTFWKTVTMDRANLLESLIALLKEHSVQYCVVGGQAVNAYVEPLVSLELEIVVADHEFEPVTELLKQEFIVKAFPHGLNISAAGSDLRVQIQTDERYAGFVGRAVPGQVLGLELPVAALEDVLKGKTWAAQDPERQGSQRQKDLADIARILERYPELRSQVPKEIRGRLVEDADSEI